MCQVSLDLRVRTPVRGRSPSRRGGLQERYGRPHQRLHEGRQDRTFQVGGGDFEARDRRYRG